MVFNVYYQEYSPSLLLPDRFGGKVASPALSDAPDWWISSFTSSNFSSLSARMLSLMNETPPPPARANRKCWNGDDKVDGRGLCPPAANQLPGFILAFPVVFHSQKERGGKQGSIHKNLPWHENSQHVFLFLTLFRVSFFPPSLLLLMKSRQKRRKTRSLHQLPN